MKQPNGYGSISKLTGKRRKPFMVRTACTYDTDGTALKESRQILGYYATKKEALMALAEFNANPYDLSAHKYTLGEVIELWKKCSKLSYNSLNIYDKMLHHFSDLTSYKLEDLSLGMIQPIIDDLTPSSQRSSRSALISVYEFAIKREIVDKNVAKLIETDEQKKSNLHQPFTAAEISDLWNTDKDIAKLCLILIYTGWRITELLTLEDIDYDNSLMRGGIKTEAGKNRVVPMHPRIIPLVRELDGKLLGNNTKYSKVRYLWNAEIKGHTFHDTRHTFVSLLQSKGADHLTLQKLVGHASNVTDDVYTHKSIDELRAVINLLE